MPPARLQPPPFSQNVLGQDGKPTPVWREFLLRVQQQVDVNAAPADAGYLITQANSFLTGAINLGLFATGYLRIVVALGVAAPASVATIPTSDLTGILTVPNGGTGRASLTDGAVIIGNAAALVTQVGPGAAGTVLKGTGADPAFAAVDLSTDVTGTLPLAQVADIAFSTYTPTLTNVTNLTASTAFLCQYVRVGNVVTVSGRVDVDPTAPGATELGISLPIASNFANNFECGGTAASPGIAGQSMAILADATNNRASMQWVAVDVTNQSTFFSFTYLVI